MNKGIRLGVALVAIFMLTGPIAYAVDTRPVHEAYYDAFVPEAADEPADIKDAFVNCGEHTDNDAWTQAHTENPDLAGGDSDGSWNAELNCWDSDEHDLWTDDDGYINAASAPFYECTADDVNIDVSLQNPFPMYVPDPIAEDAPAPEDDGYDEWVADHGVLVSSGSFYVIPEITGEHADQVEAVWFSFLETTPTLPGAGLGGGSDAMCEDTDAGAVAAGGAYYEFYRGDKDPEDGWTIPVNTLLVPDNVYGAKLTFLGHGIDGVDENALDEPYPGGLDVLGMGYVYAIVDNRADETAWSPCTPTEDPCENQDTTPPWPQVVPGDVPLTGDNKGTIEVTFGEAIQTGDIEVRVNDGPSVIAEDDRTGFDEAVTDPFPLMAVDDQDWGDQFVIDLDDDLLVNDEITVTATDLHGNNATKTVTLS